MGGAEATCAQGRRGEDDLRHEFACPVAMLATCSSGTMELG